MQHTGTSALKCVFIAVFPRLRLIGFAWWQHGEKLEELIQLSFSQGTEYLWGI